MMSQVLPDLPLRLHLPKQYLHRMLMPTTANLTRVAKMAESGQLKVVMNRIYPFEKSMEAYDNVGEGTS